MGIFNRRNNTPPEDDPPQLRDQLTGWEAYPLRLTEAGWLGIGSTYSGATVNETTAMGLTAVYRSVAILSGTAAGLPLKSYRNLSDGTRERINTWVDNPGAPIGMTPFQFKELMMVHLLLHGNFYGLHIYNGAGAIVGLQPIHPNAVTVKLVESEKERQLYGDYIKYFTVTVRDGKGNSSRDFSPADLLHIPGLSTDGITGLSPITAARQALGAGLAADEAAARQFGNGFMVGGIVTSEDDVDPDEAKAIKDDLNSRLKGAKNAGDIAFVNRSLKFTPWTMSHEDAQFFESRQFQIEEVARLFGVPKVLLAQDGASTWGQGIMELNRGLARYTLAAYTTRIEEALSSLLPRPQFVEFDYKSLLQGTPETELQMLIAQKDAGILTVNEVRAIMNLAPLENTEQEIPNEDV